jgi:hypothetical protein
MNMKTMTISRSDVSAAFDDLLLVLLPERLLRIGLVLCSELTMLASSSSSRLRRETFYGMR